MSVEFVGIELELRGEEGVIRDLNEIDRIINSLNGKKKLDLGMANLKRELAAANGELEKFRRYQQEAGGKGKSAWADMGFEKARNRVRDLNQAIREVNASARTMGQTFTQTFNKISSKVAHIGSSMQSFGNALTRFTNPFSRITTGLLYGAGYKALNLLTEGFSGAFERYDTMQTYEKSLAALGLDATQKFVVGAGEAQTAIENLNDAVLGLPTGLDEIVAAQKVYAGATNEMVKSTKTAIAANNTFIASGMDARSQRFMQKYLVSLASGAELTTNQWQSMGRIAPLALQAVAKEMGVTTEAIRSGKVEGQEFLDAFIKVGTEGKIQAAANVMKTTWEGLSANIQNATKRMGESILKAADSAFEAYNGRNLVQNLLGFDAEGNEIGGGIKHWINSISESIQKWVKANPDKIIDFFNTLKGIDWKGLFKGFAQGMGDMLKVIEALAKVGKDKDLSWIGKWMPRLAVLGRAMTILGGITKGSRHSIATIGATIATLRRAAGKGSLMGAFGELFGGKGKTLGKAAEEMTEASGSMGKFSLGLSKWFKGWAQVAVAIGGSAFVGWASVKAFKSAVKNFGETVDIIKDIDWKTGKKALAAFGGFLAGFAGLSWVVGEFGVGAGTSVLIGEAIVGAITTLATGFLALDMGLIKKGMKNFSDAIKYLNDIPDITNLDGLKDKVTNAIEVFNEISGLLAPQRNNPVFGEGEGGIKGIGLFTASKVKNIAGAIKNLKSAALNINALSNISVNKGATKKVNEIVDALGETASHMWVLMGFGFGNIKGNIENISKSLSWLKKAVVQVNGFSDVKVNKKGVSSIRKAISDISSAFDGQSIGDLRAKITAFVNSINDALAEFEKFNKTIYLKTKVKLGPGFQSSVTTAVRQINAAGGRIQSAVDGIPSTLTKQVTVRIVVNTITSGLSAVSRIARDALNSAQATGGMVYRAGGGGIPFKRRGTDTVPAMLTPGEYVQRKKAVDYFGIDFMRKVNSLDMRGAMHELMTRAGGMAGMNKATTINNYYNNNQKVTQNINTNSPDFAFRSASRFVGAL